jgi:hypothetical protein
LNHIAFIYRHSQRVVAYLDTLAAAGAALGKATIAGRTGRDWRLVVGWLCWDVTFARGFERHRLTLNAQAIVLPGLSLLAARAAAGAAAVALALPLLLALALLASRASLSILAGLPLLASLSILAILLSWRGLAILAGLLTGLGLGQLLDRPRQVVERLGRILPALPQAIGALVELIGQLRGAALNLLSGILQRIRQLVARRFG